MGRKVRMVPLTFDWPLNETWIGFLNPFNKHRSKCRACDGTGLTPTAKAFSEQWYGNHKFDPAVYGARPLTEADTVVRAFAERNVDHSPEFYGVIRYGREAAVKMEASRLFDRWKNQWSHHLIQADVDALVAGDRLYDFTHRFVPGEGWVPRDPMPAVTADEVNAWSFLGPGHDSINQSVCLHARCEREGVTLYCEVCGGDGEAWPTKAHKDLAEAWEGIPPPEGDAFQMWQTVSEGDPISPPFATPEELARWLADHEGETGTYDQWLGMIRKGWAPSGVGTPDGYVSGVAFVGSPPERTEP